MEKNQLALHPYIPGRDRLKFSHKWQRRINERSLFCQIISILLLLMDQRSRYSSYSKTYRFKKFVLTNIMDILCEKGSNCHTRNTCLDQFKIDNLFLYCNQTAKFFHFMNIVFEFLLGREESDKEHLCATCFTEQYNPLWNIKFIYSTKKWLYIWFNAFIWKHLWLIDNSKLEELNVP